MENATRRPTSSSNKEFYCSCCDLDLKSQIDYNEHIQGKKHKKNEKIVQEKINAECSIFVSNLQGIPDPEKFLRRYFSPYGIIDNVSLGRGFQFAFVRFDNAQSAKKAIRTYQHWFSGRRLFVREYKYKDVQQEGEEKQKVAEDEHKEIRDRLSQRKDVSDQFSFMTKHLLLSSQDLDIRGLICKELGWIFYPYFETTSVHEFGSSINGYGMKGCDLDLFLDFNIKPNTPLQSHHEDKVLYPLPFRPKGIRTLPSRMIPFSQSQINSMQDLDKVKLVCQILRTKSPVYKELFVVPAKRCPIVKFHHSPSGLKCDLSLNNRKALYNSRLLRLFSQDPRVQQLVVVIRYWARAQLLTSQGGTTCLMTSYALTWLVLYYLMHRKPRVIPLVNELSALLEEEGVHQEVIDTHQCLHIPLSAKLPLSKNQESIADLLHGFFEYYTSSVDWDHKALSTWDGEVLQKQSLEGNPLYAGCKIGVMTMLDPFVLCHNILANVSDRVMSRFQTEAKKALEITKKWASLEQPEPDEQGNVKPWGVAEIFIPSPPDPEEPKNKHKRTNRLNGEQMGGIFTINLHPPAQILSVANLVKHAEELGMTPNSYWCSLVKKMIVTVLETVYFSDIQESPIEETKTITSSDSDNMNVEINDKDGDSCSILSSGERKNDHDNDETMESIDDVMMEAEGETTTNSLDLEKRVINKDKNKNDSKADVSKRAVQTNDTRSKKLKRDSDIGEKLDIGKDRESNSVSNASNKNSEGDSGRRNTEEEKRTQAISSLDSASEHDKTEVSRLPAREDASSASKESNDKAKTVSTPPVNSKLSKRQRKKMGIADTDSSSDLSSPKVKDDKPTPTNTPANLSQSQGKKGERRSKDSVGGSSKGKNSPKSPPSTVSPKSSKKGKLKHSPPQLSDVVSKIVGDKKEASKIWSFSCSTKDPMWLYRNQMRESLTKAKALKGLALEREVSKSVLAKIERLKSTDSPVKKLSQQTSAASVSSANASKGGLVELDKISKPNTDEPLKKSEKHLEEDMGSVKELGKTSTKTVAETTVKKSEEGDEKDSCKTSAGSDDKSQSAHEEKVSPSPVENAKQSPTGEDKRKSSPQGNQNHAIPFSCKLVEIHADNTKHFPSVSLAMQTDLPSKFRNFYSSFSNVIVQLVSCHLFDVDEVY